MLITESNDEDPKTATGSIAAGNNINSPTKDCKAECSTRSTLKLPDSAVLDSVRVAAPAGDKPSVAANRSSQKPAAQNVESASSYGDAHVAAVLLPTIAVTAITQTNKGANGAQLQTVSRTQTPVPSRRAAVVGKRGQSDTCTAVARSAASKSTHSQHPCKAQLVPARTATVAHATASGQSELSDACDKCARRLRNQECMRVMEHPDGIHAL